MAWRLHFGPYLNVRNMVKGLLKQALLVMDVQSSIAEMLEKRADYLAGLAGVIGHARSLGIPVIYVVVGFRPQMPEISPNNKSFAQSRERLAGSDLAAWMQIAPQVAPLDREPIVIKRRVSAFTGSDLDVLLRAQNVQHLILTGIATSGVVLSTLREAADKDFRITVLREACADRDEEVHGVLMDKVFPRQAEVLSVAEWMTAAG